MSPDLALSTYLHRAAQQNAQLSAYSAVTIVRAQLPDSSQQGEFELQRKFEAPHTLLFTPLHYTGDGFVKNNVITRLLQSEVDHVQKDDPNLTAVSPLNYKFSYKGAGHIQDRLVHKVSFVLRQAHRVLAGVRRRAVLHASRAYPFGSQSSHRGPDDCGYRASRLSARAGAHSADRATSACDVNPYLVS
ncbi:MAG: hypothetical protein DMG81_13040 [Acidobacteria bacterium]|nr:MAG: hypothetical protein DMG81_13040 [Acidobacteriota bacterium]